MKRTNYYLTALFLHRLIFLKMMYSQSNQTGILDVLEIKNVAAQLWWAALKDFFLILSILHFGGDITVTFLRKKKKSKRCLNFSFYHDQSFTRIYDRKRKIVKNAVYHENMCPNWISCLNRISILENQVNVVTKIGCSF